MDKLCLLSAIARLFLLYALQSREGHPPARKATGYRAARGVLSETWNGEPAEVAISRYRARSFERDLPTLADAEAGLKKIAVDLI